MRVPSGSRAKRATAVAIARFVSGMSPRTFGFGGQSRGTEIGSESSGPRPSPPGATTPSVANPAAAFSDSRFARRTRGLVRSGEACGWSA